jgi:hypothetical protein
MTSGLRLGVSGIGVRAAGDAPGSPSPRCGASSSGQAPGHVRVAEHVGELRVGKERARRALVNAPRPGRRQRGLPVVSGIWLEELERNPGRFIPERHRAKHDGGAVAIDLNRPMAEVLAELGKHPVKTQLSLTGTLIVARDIAHAKIKERLDRGEGMPQYLKDHPVYYAGPAAVLAKENIKKVELLEYSELGMEAIYRIQVEDFPAFILVDDKGVATWGPPSDPSTDCYVVNLHTCATRKHTVKPMARGNRAATAVHLRLPVSR